MCGVTQCSYAALTKVGYTFAQYYKVVTYCDEVFEIFGVVTLENVL